MQSKAFQLQASALAKEAGKHGRGAGWRRSRFNLGLAIWLGIPYGVTRSAALHSLFRDSSRIVTIYLRTLREKAWVPRISTPTTSRVSHPALPDFPVIHTSRFFRKLNGFDLSYANIELDATAPVVIDLYSSKLTSPWGGVYTVGEEVRLCGGERVGG